MDQGFETTHETEASAYLRQRREQIAKEQEAEIARRDEPAPLKVSFRKSDAEERLISKLTNRVEE